VWKKKIFERNKKRWENIELDVRDMPAEFSWFKTGPVAGFYEYGNQILHSMKGGEYIVAKQRVVRFPGSFISF
jgi:hypothetical protein